MEEFIILAGNYGFPMLVAGYLLIRIEPVIKDLQKSITMLTLVIARQSDVDVNQMQQILDSRKRN
ncbi:MAG: YvrJ family protein [Clostridia bacterium]|nr:YvrJ family protein [Clostridia bacterium]